MQDRSTSFRLLNSSFKICRIPSSWPVLTYEQFSSSVTWLILAAYRRIFKASPFFCLDINHRGDSGRTLGLKKKYYLTPSESHHSVSFDEIEIGSIYKTLLTHSSRRAILPLPVLTQQFCRLLLTFETANIYIHQSPTQSWNRRGGAVS